MMLSDYLERSEEPRSDIAFVPPVEDDIYLDDSTAVQTGGEDDIGGSVDGGGNIGIVDIDVDQMYVKTSVSEDDSVDATATTNNIDNVDSSADDNNAGVDAAPADKDNSGGVDAAALTRRR